MRRKRSFVGICLLALVVVGGACSVQALQDGSTQQSPVVTTTTEEPTPLDAEKGASTLAAPVDETKNTDTLTGSEKSPLPIPNSGTPDERPLPQQVPFLEETMTTGEVPEDLLQDIINDVMERTGADLQSIEVRRAEAVVWRDGSLGCPKPGMMYTQALVDGYWVVLSYDGEDYDYRANSRGYFALCEESVSLRSGPLDSGERESPTQ